MTRLEHALDQQSSVLRELRAVLPSLRRAYSGAVASGGAAMPLPDGGDELVHRSRVLDGLASDRTDAFLSAIATAAAVQRRLRLDSAPCPPHRIPPSSLATYPQPPPCAFLRPGQAFEGRQRVAHHYGAVPKQEHLWEVHAVVQSYDVDTGYIAGTMEASNVPDMPAPVTTFFEGEIIDNRNHSFYTADWDACADTDFAHWSKFPSFRQIHAEVVRHGGRCPSLADHPWVYMRWKEKFFVRGSECRLTIAGFYYLAVSRSTGAVLGYYFDPNSSPDQKLELTALRAGAAGFAFPHYELA